MLARIMPHSMGFDLRMFECPNCEHIHEMVAETGAFGRLRRSSRLGCDPRLSKELHDPARRVAGFNFHDRMDEPSDERPFYGQRCFLAAMLIIAAASRDFWISRLERLHARPSRGTQNGSATTRRREDNSPRTR